jgi:hypothetical protein
LIAPINSLLVTENFMRAPLNFALFYKFTHFYLVFQLRILPQTRGQTLNSLINLFASFKDILNLLSTVFPA